jgi:hypothetical protein
LVSKSALFGKAGDQTIVPPEFKFLAVHISFSRLHGLFVVGAVDSDGRAGNVSPGVKKI